MDLVKKVKENIRRHKLFSPKEKIILAVSGGVDSAVLLDVLYSLSLISYCLSLVVVHLNHGLRGKDSDQDQKLVKELTQKYGLRFETKKIDIKKIAKQKKANLEEIAREERYKFLAKVAKKYKAKKIITAHHADDQIETVLLNYSRGAGPKGLSGMSFESQLSAVNCQLFIVRPLLNVWKEEILKYQKENNLIFRQDKSNFDVRIARNYLKLKVIPELEKQDKGFKIKILEESKGLRELIFDLEPKINEIYKKIKEKEFPNAVILNLPKFRQLKDNLLAEILKKALSFLQKDLKNISREHIISFLKAVKSGKVGKTIVLPNQLQAVIDYDSVILLKGSFPKIKLKKRRLKTGKNRIPEIGLMVKLKAQNKTSGRKGFSFDLKKTAMPVFVRAFMPGDSFTMKGLKGTKKLQDLFVDLKISKRLRELLPIITDKKGKILGVLGVRQSDEAQIGKDTGKILRVDFRKLKYYQKI